ncbi:MAG: 50S ribosomal protein L37e [Candidatus Altiarchaeales archaeon]|nr:50S ribosomal protein L37e [Candidatus Altiarchaeales archaeon]MBD3416839.1 50S ribosomal protein L37e [Candidatus Altiarchaeales archaeon]
MTKGTPSLGKRGKRKTHVNCPRCGGKSYHQRKKECASCGFGRSKRMKSKNPPKRKR